MNTDFRISVEFLTHPKIRELRRRLGPEAVLCLIEIYAHCATRSIEGYLPGEHAAVERLAQWSGAPGMLVAALLELHLLDQLDEELRVHDWAENQPYVIHAGERKERARKAGLASVERRRQLNQPMQPPNGRHLGPDAERSKSNRQFDEDRTGRSNTIEPPAPAPAPAPAQPGELPAPVSATGPNGTGRRSVAVLRPKGGA